MKAVAKPKWKTASLASISRVFTDGNWIETKDQSTTGIRLVQTGNVGEGTFKDRRDKARWIDDETFTRLNCFEVLPGDCLISRLPDPVGRACLIPETGDKMITAVDCSIIRPDASKVDSNFLVYFTQSREYLRDVDERCSGTTRRRISRKNLGKVPIPLPPLEEQQRIVAVLDEAFEGLARARAHAEANLQNARELFESALRQVFDDGRADDAVRPISEIATVTSSKRVMKKDYVESGVPFLRTKEVKQLSNEESITTELFISRKHFEELKKRNGAPVAGDVLITAIGTIGEIYVVQDLDEFYFKDGNVLWLREMHSVSPHFLRYSLLNFVKELQSLSHGAAYNALPIAKLKSHKMRIPDRDEQLRLVQKLDTINEETRLLQQQYETKLQNLDDLRQSLLQKAFAGELT